MNRRTQKAYEMVFEFISKKIFDLSSAKCFITDFEVAMRNALRIKYPSASHRGCAFHFAQAVRKNAAKIDGFIEFLRNNLAAKKIYYKLMYLVHLPPIQIDIMFNSLKQSAREINDVRLNQFIGYFERQWIVKEGSWKITVFGKEVRTTSPAEGYNRYINEYCQKKGSFIWFCCSIRSQEFMKTNEFRAFVESGGIVGAQQKKTDKVVEQIQLTIANLIKI